MASSGPADLPRIREQVGRALEDFLDRQRVRLSAIGDEMPACLDAIVELLAGGKRLRPAFCYWGWRAASGEDCPQALAAAAALELLHASALVHDDVMDGSDTRRGLPAVHRRFAARHVTGGWRGSAEAFGAGAAILIGDLLLAWTDELFHASGLPQAALRRAQPVLDAMRTEVFSGQYLDLAAQAAASTSVQSALRVVTYKSAKYTVERPLHLGVALADGAGRLGAGQGSLSAALTAYGIPLGIAFQLRDDILAVFGDPAVTGKPVGDDVREGKRTVLMAIAHERADDAQAALLERHLGDPLLSDMAAAEARKIIVDTGALAETELIIDGNIRDAMAALEEAPITQACKDALGELAVAATTRRD